MRKTLAALGIVAALSAGPALAGQGDAAAHLGHLGHGGLGTRLTAAQVARLPRHYVAIPREEGAKRRHKALASDRTLAQRAGYQSVTTLTNSAFPPFYPGLGEVYVRPKTIPLGPFLTFDRKGHQVSTVYMVGLEQMNSHQKFEAAGIRKPHVDHLTVYYHGGHPGVDFPHYHYVLWHVSKKGEKRVEK